MKLVDFDHVNLAMPADEQDKAREFYGGVLGLPELKIPPGPAGRGTIWFGTGRVTVHLAVEDGFRPALRAHPAFLVDGLKELKVRCEAAGYKTIDDNALPGFDRFFVNDSFGNRIECMERRKG